MPFHAVVGHRHLTALLAQAIDRDTLPPTLLFAGPAGVGKWRVALATAEVLNCQQPVRGAHPGEPAVDACGACRACQRIARGTHVDVLTVTPDEKASIKVDVVRDVLSRTSIARSRAAARRPGARADTLRGHAQNALLKSLEEPPPATVFILVTAVPGALLPTVRSRSMTLRFGRLTAGEVAEVLARDHGVADGEAGRCGAGRRQHRPGPRARQRGRGGASRDGAAAAARPPAAAIRRALQAATAVTGTGGRRRSGPRRGRVHPRDGLVDAARHRAINSGADARVLANPVIADDLRTLAGSFGGDRAREAFGAVHRALDALGRNGGAKVVTEWLAMHL